MQNAYDDLVYQFYELKRSYYFYTLNKWPAQLPSNELVAILDGVLTKQEDYDIDNLKSYVKTAFLKSLQDMALSLNRNLASFGVNTTENTISFRLRHEDLEALSTGHTLTIDLKNYNIFSKDWIDIYIKSIEVESIASKSFLQLSKENTSPWIEVGAWSASSVNIESKETTHSFEIGKKPRLELGTTKIVPKNDQFIVAVSNPSAKEINLIQYLWKTNNISKGKKSIFEFLSPSIGKGDNIHLYMSLPESMDKLNFHIDDLVLKVRYSRRIGNQ